MALDSNPQTEVPLLQAIVRTYGVSESDLGQSEVPLLEQWVQGLGGTPTGPTEVYLLKEILYLLAPTAIPGPSEVYLLRQILEALGGDGQGKTEVPLLQDIYGIVSSATGIPENVTTPALSRTSLSVGTNVSVSNGTWTNFPTSYTYQWFQDGAPIVGATSNNYTAQAGDIGTVLSAEVTASNHFGPSAPEPSNDSDPVAASSYYLRPDGVSYFLRPDGVSRYVRP